MHPRSALFIPLLFVACSKAPHVPTNPTDDPDAVLVGTDSLPKILLLGTFHFDYPGWTSTSPTKSDRMDVLTPGRQREVEELVRTIMRFRPNKLCIEAEDDWGMREYHAYKTGKKPMGRNEIFQIGFRLMEQAGLDTLYPVDAVPMIVDLYDGRDSLLHRAWLDSLYVDWDFGGDDVISKRYTEWYEARDRAIKDQTLLEIFLAMNDDHTLDRTYGAYLVGDFKLGGTRGADINAIHWYDRNLRIFRKIQDITTSPDDRILVLIGAGHVGILKHLFQCSPEYDLIRLSDLVH